jgi:hypothetical protein
MAISVQVLSVPYVTPVRFLQVPAHTVDITFDGVADEISWSSAQPLTLFNIDGWDGTDADFSGYLKLCWDMHYLYLFADITDDINHSMPPDSWESWMFDCIEFHLDLDTNNQPSTTYDDNTIQLRFNRGVDSAHIPGRAQVRDFYFYQTEKPGNNGWILEAGIPWTCAMPEGSLPDDFEEYFANIMGFDAAFSDSDNAYGDPSVGARDAMMAWDSDDPDDFFDRTEDLAWCNTSVFGIIDLIGSPAPPPPPPQPPDPGPYIQPVRLLNIPPASETIIIDGVDYETCYSTPQTLNLFNPTDYTGPNDLGGYFRVAWDLDYLYFFASVDDDVDGSWIWDEPSPWLYDNIEFFINLDTLHSQPAYQSYTVQLRFNRGYNIFQCSGRALSDDFMVYFENKSGGNGWILETAIPWTCALPMGSLPEDIVNYIDNAMGFDIIFNDFDGTGEATQWDAQLAWDSDDPDTPDDRTEYLAWNNTYTFGIVRLLDEPVTPEPDPYYMPVRTMTVPATVDAIQIDGNDDEESWGEAQDMNLFDPTGWTGLSDFSGYFKTCWDTSYFYFYADVSDDIDHSWDWYLGEPWMFDCIELFFDLDTNHASSTYDENSIQLRMTRGTDSLESSGRADRKDFLYHWHNKPLGTGWIVEAAVPWTCAMPYGSLPEDFIEYIGNYMGFDVTFSDSDNAYGDPTMGARDAMMAWDSDDPDTPEDRTEDLAWNNTHVFGIINLIGEPVPPPIENRTYVEPINIMDIPLRTSPIVIDAYMNENCWSAPEDLSIFNYTNWIGEYDLDASFRTCWDSTYLYIFASIVDDIDRSWNWNLESPWSYDNLEIYLDLDTFCTDGGYRSNSTISLRFCRGLDEVQNSGRANQEDFLYAWRNFSQGNGWILEAGIPWTSALAFGSDPEDIVQYLPTIGFDIIVTDLDSYSVPERTELSQAAWDRDYNTITDEIIEDNAWYNTRLFGIADLLSTGVSIEPALADDMILVYPNPAGQVIYLDNLSAVCRLEILSVNGQVLWSVNNPGIRISIDISSLQSGIYFIRVFKTDDSVRNIKFAVE